MKRWQLWLAFALGAALFLALPLGPAGEHARVPTWRWAAAGLCAAGGFVPGAAKIINRWLDRIRAPSPSRRARVAFAVGAASFVYFLVTAVNQDRDFFPKTQDECSYAIQTQMVAHGRLWMRQHPLADFFESFYLLVKPVYASMYFPGTALLNAPAIWLHLPTWLIPLLVASAIVGLVYRIVSEVVDGAAGALAALLVVSLSWYRAASIMLMAQLPLLLLGLLMLWAWLRWRNGPRLIWLALIGALAGWAAITRPVDALCFAVPVGIAIVAAKGSIGFRLRAIVLVIACALPFLLIQLAFDKGVTGRFLRTPFDEYADRDYPGTRYGFHAVDPAAEPASKLPAKRMMYDQWVKPYLARHQPGGIIADWWRWRLPLIADVTLPARSLLILVPIGLLGLTTRQRWQIAATVPLFIALYVGYAFFLEHYALTIVPAVAMIVALGVRQLAAASPRASVAALLGVLAFAATGLWELNHWDPHHAVDDEPFRSTWLRKLHELNVENAIVLFRFAPVEGQHADLTAEPVYNIDVAWPDDAPLIRARDLGERNIELYRYYAKLGQNRTVYRLDRITAQYEDLGKVEDLARQPP